MTLIQPTTSEIIILEFPSQSYVSGSDDLIADKIFTENFELVLNQKIEDIYDEIMKIPSQSRETSNDQEERKLAFQSAEEGSSFDS